MKDKLRTIKKVIELMEYANRCFCLKTISSTLGLGSLNKLRWKNSRSSSLIINWKEGKECLERPVEKVV